MRFYLLCSPVVFASEQQNSNFDSSGNPVLTISVGANSHDILFADRFTSLYCRFITQ